MWWRRRIWVMASTAVEVTVTATVADGFGWGTITSPWRRVDAGTAVWVQTLAAGSCADGGADGSAGG